MGKRGFGFPTTQVLLDSQNFRRSELTTVCVRATWHPIISKTAVGSCQKTWNFEHPFRKFLKVSRCRKLK